MGRSATQSPLLPLSNSPAKSRNFVFGLFDALLEKKTSRCQTPVKDKMLSAEDSTATLFSDDDAEELTLLPLPSKPTGLISAATYIDEPENADKQIGDFEIVRALGQGTFGMVKLAKNVKSGDLVAIKIVNKTSVTSGKQKLGIERELRLMKLLHHDYIVGVIDVYETKTTYYVVMEYAPGGELLDYIIKKGKLAESESRRFFRQLISAMDYCHKNSVLHRDLKPENLLLDANNNIKIIDFGFANTFHRNCLLDTFCGSPFYAAPEMIKGIKYVGPEVDIWSMGVILYSLLSGRLPFDANHTAELYAKIARGHYQVPHYFSADARDLISKMLVVNRSQRYTLADVLKHPWVVAGYDNATSAAIASSSSSRHTLSYAPLRCYTPPNHVIDEPHEEVIAELTSYGFKRDDITKMLAVEESPHPIISLYHLVEAARVRRDIKYKNECAVITNINNLRTAAWKRKSFVGMDINNGNSNVNSPNRQYSSTRFAEMMTNRGGSSATLANQSSQASLDIKLEQLATNLTVAFEKTSLLRGENIKVHRDSPVHLSTLPAVTI